MRRESRVGERTELKVAQYYTSLGWTVFFPFGYDTEIDMIVVKGATVRRIQVKTVYQCKEVLRANIHKDGQSKYSSDTLDILACIYNDRLWVIPMEDIEGETTLNFGRPDGSSCKTRGNFEHKRYEVRQ